MGLLKREQTMRSLLRYPAVESKSGLGHSTLCALIANGLWTKPVRVSLRTSAFPDDEVEAMIEARRAGLNEDEIRKLVEQLHAARNVQSSQAPININANPNLVAGRKAFWDDVRAGRKLNPRSSGVLP